MINENFTNKKNINLSFEDVSILPVLLGANNRNLAIIESLINVNLDSNGDTINIYGDDNICETTKIIIEEYYYIIKNQKKEQLLIHMDILISIHLKEKIYLYVLI